MMEKAQLKLTEVPRRSAHGLQVGGEKCFTFIAGPCALEPGEAGQQMVDEVARELCQIREQLQIEVIFKASFDKANRTSLNSYRGLSLAEGLREFQRIKQTYRLPVITDVHEREQVAPVAEVADILQIPAFLCRQTDLILAAAATGKWVMIKKGQFLAPHDVGPIIKKFKSSGNELLMLCDRGFSFGYNRLINDMGGLHEMRGFGVPVCFDATHSVQEPGAAKDRTGGHPEQIPALARAAVAVGIDALFMETHPRPHEALSDANTVFPLSDLAPLIAQLVKLDRLVKSF